MFPAHIDYRRLVQLILSLAVGWVFLLAMQVNARADNQTFVIPASDGYGVSDCLTSTPSCGKVVADAWCEAHGLAKAIAFGSAEDVTASIASPAPRAAPGSFLVTCRE